MGILNVTPDSFFDGGKYQNMDLALTHANKMIEDGASILDVGGYSSRPGANDISVEEELRRVIPVIEKLKATFPNTYLSIDTFRAAVAQNAIEVGATMVNDISAGDDDSEMIPTVAKLNVPFIAMHKSGAAHNRIHANDYQEVTTEVLDYFIKKIPQLRKHGIKDILIDPGFGFGKNVDHNFELLKNLEAFKLLDCPIVVGVSRKRMIYETLNIKADDALNGTTVANTIACLNGANILRVHDVKEAADVVKIIHRLAN